MNLNELRSMSMNELTQLNDMILNEIKSRRKAKSSEMAQKLFEGAKVKINHHNFTGLECTILEIKRVKATVMTPKGRFRVPMNMLEVIED